MKNSKAAKDEARKPANIPEKLLKPYDPAETEKRIYEKWQKSGFFSPEKCEEDGVSFPDAKPFSMVMPPPNVTGVLHMGHALMVTIEDVMVRFERMLGRPTLWIPGTDHAAIATQSRVEKDITKKEGKNRFQLGREEFLKRVTQFAKESHDTIVKQIKVMGASVDWSREAFTLDEPRSLAVRTAFKKMYDDGLIYRGNRIVNWDPKGQTTISDDEIVYKEEKTKFYYLKYGPFTIATARPETKFGDKYVVMHPSDERYAEYKHGQKISLEWINGPITATVIKDESIDKEFGTGVMTITPWHSHVDFEIAERHKLDKEQIIDKYGKLLPVAGEFAGMKITEAREKIVEKMRVKGLLVKEEDYTHNIATAERTDGFVEPQIMRQWFIDVNKEFTSKSNKKTTLKKIMREAVESGKIKILPDYFNKTYFHWIDNLRDWCISRQIWYGHRIPVWYKNDAAKSSGGQETFVGIEPPTKNWQKDGWEQDEDTLDTWFSSGLWTFSTLGWPDEAEMKKQNFQAFHPTTVLETGYEILFFWVARMILMSGYFLDEIPFETVYLHGTVRDAKGRKMSKSLGNGIDPIDIAEKYGADAARMALITGTAPGTDSRISEDKVKGYKHFANKLWNIARFVMSSAQNGDIGSEKTKLTAEDQKIVDECLEKITDITTEMKNYSYHIASEKIYQYIWRRFADEIIEESKPIIAVGGEKADSRSATLHILLKNSLVILHPFMPFVTEEIWSLLGNKKLLMIEKWPVLK